MKYISLIHLIQLLNLTVSSGLNYSNGIPSDRDISSRTYFISHIPPSITNSNHQTYSNSLFFPSNQYTVISNSRNSQPLRNTCSLYNLQPRFPVNTVPVIYNPLHPPPPYFPPVNISHSNDKNNLFLKPQSNNINKTYLIATPAYNMVTNTPPYISDSHITPTQETNNKICINDRLPNVTHLFMPKRTFQLLDQFNRCFLETNDIQVYKVLKSIYLKSKIEKLEFFYPLLKINYEISLKGFSNFTMEIIYISENIKTYVNNILEKRNYGISFSYFLLKKSKNGMMQSFLKKGLPMIYLKPIFLLLPYWIENTLYKDISKMKNVFYIMWSLKVIVAIMACNYEHLKEYITEDSEGNGTKEFSYIFFFNSRAIHISFNFISNFLQNIFQILEKENLYEIFYVVSYVDFFYSHCDRVFSLQYACSGMPGMLFDVFVLLSDENIKLLSSMISHYDFLKQKPENESLNFKAYMRGRLNFNNYCKNENIRKLFYDIALVYKELFCSNLLFNIFRENKISFEIEFRKWLLNNFYNLDKLIFTNVVPEYHDYIHFIETCNLFLHYICKIVLNPTLTPKTFKHIISDKIISYLKRNYFDNSTKIYSNSNIPSYNYH